MWGLSTFTYPWAFGISGYFPPKPLLPEELFKRAHNFGAQVVQIGHNVPLHTLTEEKLQEIKGLAQRYNVVLEIGTLSIREPHLLTCLRIAEQLEARFVRTLLDAPDDSPSLGEAEREIRSVLPHFAAKNIYLVLENYERRRSEELLFLFRAVNHPYLRFCFDTANSLGAFENPRDVLRAMVSYTMNVHLKEVVSFRPPYQLGFIVEGRPLGKGALGIEWVFEMLEGRHDVSYIIELLTPWQNSIESTIAREAEWAEESARFLKEFLGRKGIS
ncbi:MAG: TIM barrel protein [Atribacterota bacterium]